MNYDHEYLAYGVIKGPAYRAVRVKSLFSVSFDYSRMPNFDDSSTKCTAIKTDNVQAARKVGEMYGSAFALRFLVAPNGTLISFAKALGLKNSI